MKRIKIGNRESGIGNRESGIGNRESGIGNRESGIGNRESAIFCISGDRFCQRLLERNVFHLPSNVALSVIGALHSERPCIPPPRSKKPMNSHRLLHNFWLSIHKHFPCARSILDLATVSKHFHFVFITRLHCRGVLHVALRIFNRFIVRAFVIRISVNIFRSSHYPSIRIAY